MSLDESKANWPEFLQVFVTVGTNHNNFDRMLELVDQCLMLLPCKYEVNVQYGSSTPYVIQAGQTGISQSMFTREETENLVQSADLVFSHCGIGSLYNCLQFTRPTIIVPRLEKFQEFSDDHQLQIAQQIKRNPLIFMLNETLDRAEFLQFLKKTIPQNNDQIDLASHEFAQTLKARLLPETSGPVLTIASAGGHMTQALCVMKAIEEFHLVTSVNIKLDVGASSYHLIEDTQFSPWIHLKNIFKAVSIIRKVKPEVIFSTGGPICLPFAALARVFKVPFVYLDTLSRVEDLSNTALFLRKYTLASQMYVQWQHHVERYPDLEYLGQTFDICGSNNVLIKASLPC